MVQSKLIQQLPPVRTALSVAAAGFVLQAASAAMPSDGLLDGSLYYEVEVLNLPSTAIALDINNSEQVVGQAGGFFGENPFDAFLYDDGELTEVRYPGAFATEASSINNKGGIFGSYAFSDPTQGAPTFGFYRKPNGDFVDINYPGALATRVFGGNNRGDAVGFFLDSSSPFPQAFVRSKNGVYTPLTPPDSLFAIAIGISDKGVITGDAIDADFVAHGYLFKKGTYTVFNVPCAVSTNATRANRRGHVVGSYSNVDGSALGWGYLRTKKGVFYDLTFPASDTLTQLTGITDNGRTILGNAVFADGSSAKFLWRRIVCGEDDDDDDDDEDDDED